MNSSSPMIHAFRLLTVGLVAILCLWIAQVPLKTVPVPDASVASNRSEPRQDPPVYHDSSVQLSGIEESPQRPPDPFAEPYYSTSENEPTASQNPFDSRRIDTHSVTAEVLPRIVDVQELPGEATSKIEIVKPQQEEEIQELPSLDILPETPRLEPIAEEPSQRIVTNPLIAPQPDRVDPLQADMKRVERAQAELQTLLQATESELSSLRTANQSLIKDMQALSVSQDALAAESEAATAKIEKLKDSQSSTADSVTALQESFSALEQQQQQLVHRLDAWEQKTKSERTKTPVAPIDAPSPTLPLPDLQPQTQQRSLPKLDRRKSAVQLELETLYSDLEREQSATAPEPSIQITPAQPSVQITPHKEPLPAPVPENVIPMPTYETAPHQSARTYDEQGPVEYLTETSPDVYFSSECEFCADEPKFFLDRIRRMFGKVKTPCRGYQHHTPTHSGCPTCNVRPAAAIVNMPAGSSLLPPIDPATVRNSASRTSVPTGNPGMQYNY